MAVEARPRHEFTIDEIRAGKHGHVTPEQLEQRRRGIDRIDLITRDLRLPRGYTQALIRSGRDDPESDNGPSERS